MDIAKIVSHIKKLGGRKVKFILHFGSSAHKKSTPLSDIDVGVYYEGTEEERFKFRVKVLGVLTDNVDLHIFQDVPLTVQREMLQGKIVYGRNEQILYDEAVRVAREFSRFEKYYNACLRAVV
ncbi:MAG TPA: nucleotidyltransferase domain-containing protein [Candidatus Nanoarchaeia archaeon]|nr:nucleotidyltransferase domain-containing protein [Candidatus Nanoarchaeia archaeon]